MENEIWLPVVGFETLYQVSNLCRVKSLHKRWSKHEIRLLTNTLSPHGYHTITLKDGEREYRKQLHRIIAEAWIPNPENKPHINHKNGIKTDNRIDNLEWVTMSENMQHAYNTGLNYAPSGKDCHFAILNESQALEIFKSDLKYSELAKKYNVSEDAIGKIKTGKNWKKVTGKKHLKYSYLSKDAVLDIFNSTLSLKELSKQYGITPEAVSTIRTGKTWSSITGKKYSPKFKRGRRLPILT